MLCLADFVLDSDLCLADGAVPLKLNGCNGAISVTVSNVENDHGVPDAVLSAQLIFETDSLDENTRDLALEKLADVLNCLTYATNRKFSFRQLKRLIDWTPGIVERQAIIYHETPEWDTAEPALDEMMMDSAERFSAMQSGDGQREAMSWYRLGIQAERLEEQFTYFWFSLEIVAEALKGKERVPSKCPACQGELFCEKCNDYPTHRRYRGEAIQQIIERVHPENAKEVFESLQLIRHALMHGGQIVSVLDRLPCNEQQALNKLAFVAWHAIGLMFSNPDPRPESPLVLGHCDNLVRRNLVAGVHVATTLLRGDPNNPHLADFPTFNLSMRAEPWTESPNRNEPR